MRLKQVSCHLALDELRDSRNSSAASLNYFASSDAGISQAIKQSSPLNSSLSRSPINVDEISTHPESISYVSYSGPTRTPFSADAVLWIDSTAADSDILPTSTTLDISRIAGAVNSTLRNKCPTSRSAMIDSITDEAIRSYVKNSGLHETIQSSVLHLNKHSMGRAVDGPSEDIEGFNV